MSTEKRLGFSFKGRISGILCVLMLLVFQVTATFAQDQFVNGALRVNQNLGIGFASTDTINRNLQIKGGTNPAIRLEDTGASPFLWDIEVLFNDFRITNVTNGLFPVTIDEDAPNNSIYIDGITGYISFGGSTGGTVIPARNLHLMGVSPVVRYEDATVGNEQVWDVGANVTPGVFSAFEIQDVTNATRPFAIEPGAPADSLLVKGSGDIAVGLSTPLASIHVSRADGSAGIRVEETSAVKAKRNMLHLENNGSPYILFNDTNVNKGWELGMLGAGFYIRRAGTSPKLDLPVKGGMKLSLSGIPYFDLSSVGNLTIAGTLTQNSDVNTKENLSLVDGRVVLARLKEMPISTWNLKDDSEKTGHLGPMAQDFYAAFGLGEDDRHIAPMDAAGVALAAVKEAVREKDEQIAVRDARLAEMERRISFLEEKLLKLLGTGLGEDQPASAGSDR